MELEKFSSQLIERMERKDKHFSSKVYKYSVDVQNKATNSNIGPIIYFTEETSELQQLLCKYARGKISGNCYQVYEELADVFIMVNCLISYFRFSKDRLYCTASSATECAIISDIDAPLYFRKYSGDVCNEMYKYVNHSAASISEGYIIRLLAALYRLIDYLGIDEQALRYAIDVKINRFIRANGLEDLVKEDKACLTSM